MQEQINNLIREVEELKKWKQNKSQQQISFPIDDISESIVVNRFITGTGTATTQSLNLTGNAETITPPAQPSGTLKVMANGIIYELLYK